MDNRNTTIVSIAYDEVSDYLYGCGYSFSNNGFLTFDNTTTAARPFVVKMSWDLSSILWIKWYETSEISP